MIIKFNFLHFSVIMARYFKILTLKETIIEVIEEKEKH